MSPHIVKALLRRAASGDRGARNRLIEHYTYLADATAKRYRVDADGILDPADLLGVAMLGLTEAVDGYDASKGAGLQTHIISQARWAIVEHIRMRRWSKRAGVVFPRVGDETAAARVADGCCVEAEVLAGVEVERLWAAVDRLPALRRRIVLLHYAAEQSDRTTARSEGISSSRVHQLRHKSLVMLAQLLG